MAQWGSQPVDFNQEPRKVFINFLIWNIKEIETQLFYGGRTSHAIRLLQGLISSLDQKSQKALETQFDKLLGYESNILTLSSRTELVTIYKATLAFLHETYLKEVQFARPKYKPSKLEVPQE